MKILSVVNDEGTAMAEATLCERHHADVAYRGFAELVARGARDLTGAVKWEDSTDNDAVHCVECGLSGCCHYEKCAHCHLFVEPNDVEGEGFAEYVHLTRGDEADELIESTHEAQPSGEIHTLEWWKEWGPAEMVVRFTEAD